MNTIYNYLFWAFIATQTVATLIALIIYSKRIVNAITGRSRIRAIEEKIDDFHECFHEQLKGIHDHIEQSKNNQ